MDVIFPGHASPIQPFLGNFRQGFLYLRFIILWREEASCGQWVAGTKR